MRLGVMIGADRGDMARKISKFLADIEWADSAGLDTAGVSRRSRGSTEGGPG